MFNTLKNWFRETLQPIEWQNDARSEEFISELFDSVNIETSPIPTLADTSAMMAADQSGDDWLVSEYYHDLTGFRDDSPWL